MRLVAVAVALALTGTLQGAPPARAEVEIEEGSVVKIVDGVRFVLPEDWPVQKVGSAVTAVSVERYLAMKFKNLDARLQAMEQQINQLSLRLRVFEQTQQPQLQSGEAPAPTPGPAAEGQAP